MSSPPPPAFRCGHARAEENTRWNGTYTCCRTCYRAWENERRQHNNRSEYERQRQQRHGAQQREATRLRRLRKVLTDQAAIKPHLYPSKQA